MTPLSVTITGEAAMVARLHALGREGPAVLAGALYRAGERIMTRSKDEFVPVKWGHLRASGHVQPPATHGNAVVVTLGYGGPAVTYAVPVHENVTARHPVGEAKFLERPLFEASRTLAADLAKDVAAVLARSGR